MVILFKSKSAYFPHLAHHVAMFAANTAQIVFFQQVTAPKNFFTFFAIIIRHYSLQSFACSDVTERGRHAVFHLTISKSELPIGFISLIFMDRSGFGFFCSTPFLLPVYSKAFICKYFYQNPCHTFRLKDLGSDFSKTRLGIS